jgi:hypothetical protein
MTGFSKLFKLKKTKKLNIGIVRTEKRFIQNKQLKKRIFHFIFDMACVWSTPSKVFAVRGFLFY